MRLRNFLLLTAVVAGAAVGALEFAARSAAQDIAESLEPLATLSYGSAGIAFDGSVRLREPRLTVNRGIWKGSVLARVADLRGGGPFWLVGHVFGGEGHLPEQMRIRTSGLRMGDSPAGVPLAGWLGTSDLALFENLGCGSDALSDKDRVSMGIQTREREDELRYQFDDAAHSLDLSMDLRSENIAAIHATAQLTGLAGEHWLESTSIKKMRIARASLGYQDLGYFARRNQFCAQWLGVSATQFVDKHMDAVQAFLGVRGITPSNEVLSLYKQLATRGGALNLTSLPGSAWVPAEIESYPKEDLLRVLNITARHEDAPPIMLRLSFSSPETPVNITSVVDPPVAMSPAALEADMPASPMTGVSEQIGGSQMSGIESAPSVAPPPEFIGPAADSAKPPVAPSSAASESAFQVANPIPETDSPGRRIIASAPPPPKDSTLALVWKPGVIERLPRQSSPEREFVVVAKDRLPGLIGVEVQLLTENGKRVDGEVLRISIDAVVVSVAVARGNAELSVPFAGIREVRLRTRGGGSP